jgi:uncharacterized protein (DUF1330 family)
MSSINSIPGQAEEAISAVPKGVPVVMINMLRFRENAKYPDGRSDISGRDAYAIYSGEAFKHLIKYGAEIVWFGEALASVIGPNNECWDQIFLVRYPSIDVFIEMINSASYQDILVHRSSALKDSRLIATIEGGK